MDNFIYKIRQKDTGSFSAGGSYPQFTQRGKVWKRLKDLEAHLKLMESRLVYFDECEIVVYRMKEFFIYKMEDALEMMDVKRKMRKKKEQKRVVDLSKQTRYEEYIKLKQEFNPLDCVGIQVKVCDMKLGKIS